MRDPFRSNSFRAGSIGRDTAWSFAYGAIVRAGTMGLSVVVARLAGPAAAGAFGTALQLTALGSMAATLNLPQGLAKRLAEGDEPPQRRALLVASGGLVVSLGLIVCIALMLGAREIAARAYLDGSLTGVILLTGPLVLATASQLWVEGALQGSRRFGSLARWGAVVGVVDLVLGVLAALGGVAAVLVSRTVIRLAAVAFATFRWFGRDLAPRDSPPLARTSPAGTAAARGLLQFAGPAFLSAVVVLAGQMLLRVFLTRRFGLEETGFYHAADSIGQLLMLVPTAAVTPLLRAVSSVHARGDVGFEDLLARALERVAGFNLALSLALIGCSPWVVVMLYGGAFAGARDTLVSLGVAYGLYGLTSMWGAALLGRGEVWVSLILNAIWTATTLGAFALIPGGGAGAAAWSVLIGYAVSLTTCVLWLPARWRIGTRRVLLPTAVGVAALSLAAWLTRAQWIPPIVAALLCLGVGAAIFHRWGLSSFAREPGEPAARPE
ncbi:MAG: oligosaccharide flippase family protein [Candidatus Eisenbacteria bacterium]|uniref:Oligosaccharide flippase family protein n=1 Tax=Eiseniibacteriota bacterium TaxID=2212470 RepID=A0A849SPF8_UNCEI|nr:oligosaccharide flippase family protein [Candidatus Eisenbacteria bacterium]